MLLFAAAEVGSLFSFISSSFIRKNEINPFSDLYTTHTLVRALNIFIVPLASKRWSSLNFRCERIKWERKKTGIRRRGWCREGGEKAQARSCFVRSSNCEIGKKILNDKAKTVNNTIQNVKRNRNSTISFATNVNKRRTSANKLEKFEREWEKKRKFEFVAMTHN